MPVNLENSAVATGLEKVSFHSNPKERKWQRISNYRTIVHISHASKIMLKILQARLQQYMNQELPDVQAEFRKGRGTRDPIANICWIIKKASEFQKNCFIEHTKAFLTLWLTTNCGKFLKRQESRPPYPSLGKPVCRSRSSSQDLTWNNGLVQDWEGSVTRLYTVTPFI